MRIDRIDHLVLTVADLERTVRFSVDVLGLEAVVLEDDHLALHLGDSKINLHQAGNEYEPKAARPGPGTGDLCFTTSDPLDVGPGVRRPHVIRRRRTPALGTA